MVSDACWSMFDSELVMVSVTLSPSPGQVQVSCMTAFEPNISAFCLELWHAKDIYMAKAIVLTPQACNGPVSPNHFMYIVLETNSFPCYCMLPLDVRGIYVCISPGPFPKFHLSVWFPCRCSLA